tara:strand:- start:19079 stop:20659 length:1581 start_codon:yes stop_codon:yes gene_type:complete
MKKYTLIATIVAASFNTQAETVIIQGDRTLIQDKGVLSESNINIENKNIVRFSGIVDSNIPDSFIFNIDDQNANHIVYNTKNQYNYLGDSRALLEFLNNKIGEKISYTKNEKTNFGFIYKVIGNSVFVESNGNIVPVKIEELVLNEEIFKTKDFNLTTYFNNEINPNGFYQYSYFANGFSWKPNYTLFYNEEEADLSLSFYGNVQNNSNSNLIDIELTLLSEDNNNDFENLRVSKSMYKTANENTMIADSISYSNVPQNMEVENKEVGSISAFEVDGKVNLYSKINSNILIKDFKKLKHHKNNYVDLNNFYDSYSLKIASKGIKRTSLRIDRENNKDLKDFHFPASNIEVLLENNSTYYPYKNTAFNPVKGKDIEVDLIKNESLNYVSKIESKKDIKLIKKEKVGVQQYTQNIKKDDLTKKHFKDKIINKEYNGNYITLTLEKIKYNYHYEIKSTQFFDNKSNKDERFVVVIPNNLQNKTNKTSSDYETYYNEDYNTIEYIINIPKNTKKNTFIKHYVTTSTPLRF